MSGEQGQCQADPDRRLPSQLCLFEVGEPLVLSRPAQLEQPVSTERAEEILRKNFRERLGGLVWTANRQRIASIQPALPGSNHLNLRLHRCFQGAPRQVLMAVAAWATGRPSGRQEALAEMRRYFDQATPKSEQLPPRAKEPRALGRVFDLAEILSELNQEYFDGKVVAQISWGHAGSVARRRRTMLLGSYTYDLGLIRIHPRLDDAGVPRFVVAAVVHHEMVHAYLPNPAPAQRRVLHSREFRLLESQFAQHQEAQTWISRHLPKLLRSCART